MTELAQHARNSYVVLQVGERRFALRADTVAELAPPVRLHRFPHTSPLVTGVIVRRGRIVPVYDVGPVLFGRPSPSHRFYLIARRQCGKLSEPGAIPVNGDCELASVEAAPPDPGRPAYIAGTVQVGAESLDVVDFEALVTSSALVLPEAHS
jgi:chemotaxis signal transduction protein